MEIITVAWKEITDFELHIYFLSFMSDLKFIQNFTFLQNHILEFRMISLRSDSTKLYLKWVPVLPLLITFFSHLFKYYKLGTLFPQF